MKCEICKKAEAERAITVTENGVEKELYVCPACAEAATRGRTAKAKPPRSGRSGVAVVGGENVPQPLVEEFVKATLGFMKGMADAHEDKRRACPACGATWESVKDSGRLGCPSCWKTFACEIRGEFLSAEYGPVHTGAAPSVDDLPDAQAARRVLERQLGDAVAREDYHLAAEIKRKLDGLDAAKEEL